MRNKQTLFLFFLSVFASSLHAEEFFVRGGSVDFTEEVRSVLVGDFSSQDHLDAFVALPNSNGIAQMSLGSDFYYQLIENAETEVGLGAYALVKADINNDGRLDLLVSSPSTIDPFSSSAERTYLLTNQNNTDLKQYFISNSVLPGFADQLSMVLEDINGDSFEDLIFLEASGAAIIYGNNSGGFSNSHSIGSSGLKAYQTVADLDGDEIKDIAITTDDNDVLLYKGSEEIPRFFFDEIRRFAVGANPQGIKHADLDADGDIDLVIANQGEDTLTLALNNGSASFTTSTLAVCNGPYQLVLADFNSDSKKDVALICNADGATDQGVLQVYAGNGDGTFVSTPLFEQNLGTNPFDLVTDDFNADGKADLLISVTGSNKIVTLLGNLEPRLSNFVFNNTSGEFKITYTDADNEVPSSITLNLDGTSYNLNAVDVSDTNYTDGKDYSHTQADIAAGTHSYRFAASDGTYAAITAQGTTPDITTEQTLTINATSSGGCSLATNAKPNKATLLVSLSTLCLLLLQRQRKQAY